MELMPKPKLLFITSFPPRECGIATFCQDLLSALDEQFHQSFSFEICALEDDKATAREYPDRVRHILNTHCIESYNELAEKINKDDRFSAVCIQHEFGLFGGTHGQDLLTLLYTLKKPVAIIFHTVLPEPDNKLKMVVETIADLVDSIIVMTNTSADQLTTYYTVDREKVNIIPHGTHPVPWDNQAFLKRKYGLEGKTVLSTFGLISANKSIETALQALPEVVKKYPETVYLVLGKTHPKVIENEGERYRNYLEALVTSLKIQAHVVFVNEYLSLPVLLDYLRLSDLYLFTSKDPNQAVSGTFAYALSCACPVLSTPIPHAKEVLKADRGILFDFSNVSELSVQIKKLLGNPKKRKEMAINAYSWSRHTIWPNVAVSFMNEFNKISKNMATIQYKKPKVNFTHLKKLTTALGVIQFSKVSTPDLNSGYTIDDNARALIAVLMEYEATNDQDLLLYAETYLDFIIYCQQTDGRFMNYVDEQGRFHQQNHYVNLEDSNTRALWALGHLLGMEGKLPMTLIQKAQTSFDSGLRWLPEISSPRAIGFGIKALFEVLNRSRNTDYQQVMVRLADKLVHRYHTSAESGWDWFEDYLTYANAVMPEALIKSYTTIRDSEYLYVALNSFNFLLSQTFTKDQIKVVSNRGWQHKGKPKTDHHGEQPIDVAYTILALDSFYEALSIERYLEYMEVAYSWFLGNNHLQQIMYDVQSGGCYDGLEETTPNLNQGAESTICFLMASMTMRQRSKSEHITLTDQELPTGRPPQKLLVKT